MSDLIARTARLVPYTKRPKHINSFVTAYVYEPVADDAGGALGNLYVVIEALVSGRASEEVVDLIIQTVGEKYYNEPQPSEPPAARFEAAVRHLNHALAEYVNKGNAAWIGKLSAVIAVQAAGELHVTQTGSAEAFLYRGKAVSRITQPETAKPATPTKTFGTIATGELEPEDRVLIATPALVHQIPLKKLQSVVSTLGPTAGIQEISQLLAGTTPLRIAALIIEFTTPELAALKVRSGEPDDIELVAPAGIAETALQAATPIAQNTAETSKKIAAIAHGRWTQLRPKLRQFSLTLVDHARSQLSTKKGRLRALIIMGISVVVVATGIYLGAAATAAKRSFNTYQATFKEYQAVVPLITTDKATARAKLTELDERLEKLAKQSASIDKTLKNSPLLAGEPSTLNEFRALVKRSLGEVDGIISTTVMTVAEIGAKNGKPLHMELSGTKAYVIDSGNNNALSIVDLATGTQRDSKANTTNFGNVVNTTLSAAGDGIYILTSKPSVWFYKFSSDTLTEQTVSFGSWPQASAIASYGSNLYLLSGSTIFKHVRNASGYSPKSEYIQTGGAAPAGLAVDGFIYALEGTSLKQYLGNVLKQTATIPTPGTFVNLRSTANGDLILAIQKNPRRIVVWTSNGSALTFLRQIDLSEGKNLADADYDPNLKKMFALVDNRLVSFNFAP